MLTVSSASLFKGMDDAVICRRRSLRGEEALKSVAAQPEGMSLVWHKGCWIRWGWSRRILRHGDLGVISHLQLSPASLGQRAKGGGLCPGFEPKRAHWLQRGLSVDAQKSASVKAELVGHWGLCLWSAGLLFGAPGDPGGGPASGCPGQQKVDQRTKQQAHKHRQTEG